MPSFGEPLFPDQRLPLLVRARDRETNLAHFLGRHLSELEAALLEHGALLFRDFRVGGLDDFDAAGQVLSRRRMHHVYGSTPRTLLSKLVFTASEYPADLEIPLHSEHAYQKKWPLTLAFCCLTPSATGGETPIADLRRVTTALGSSMMEKLEALGVEYVRNYMPYLDIPWQSVFQTDSRAAVTEFCAKQGIMCAWSDDGTLKTRQVCQGVARHPRTGERVIFNQAHLFHISALGDSEAATLLEAFGPDGVPRNARWGDGSEFTSDDLQRLREAFYQNAVVFPWQAGDVMWLDNMQVAHGRRSYGGDRKVLVILLDENMDAAVDMGAPA